MSLEKMQNLMYYCFALELARLLQKKIEQMANGQRLSLSIMQVSLAIIFFFCTEKSKDLRPRSPTVSHVFTRKYPARITSKSGIRDFDAVQEGTRHR